MSEKCLMIVDDEEDFRYTVREHFVRRGYEVLEAGDGEEALELFAEDPGRIGLVITDIAMPRMGGQDLIRALRSRKPLLPIIGITGHADIQGKLSSLGEGAYYFIDKPILDRHWPFVDRMVENAIKLHEREQEVEAFRNTEREIARMLRHYILQRPLEKTFLRAEAALAPVPSNRPSGDYVECFHRSRNELLFYVADASGKKSLLPAFTACLSNMVLHRAQYGRRPAVKEIIHEIDEALDGLRRAGAFGAHRFLTFFIGCLDLAKGKLAYVNAGHLPAFLLRRVGAEVEVVHLEYTSPAVGQVKLLKKKVKEKAEELRAGDLLFLYSDGVTASLAEETESDHSPAVIGRLEEMVKALAERSPQAVVDDVMAQLKKRVGEKGFEDDTTLLAIRLHKAAGKG